MGGSLGTAHKPHLLQNSCSKLTNVKQAFSPMSSFAQHQPFLFTPSQDFKVKDFLLVYSVTLVPAMPLSPEEKLKRKGDSLKDPHL